MPGVKRKPTNNNNNNGRIASKNIGNIISKLSGVGVTQTQRRTRQKTQNATIESKRKALENKMIKAKAKANKIAKEKKVSNLANNLKKKLTFK